MLIVAGLGLVLLLVSLLVINWRRHQQMVLKPSEGPSFEVRVEQPLGERPPWEVPGIILGSRERGPRLDQHSVGVKVGNVGPNHFEMSADDGWDLLIETDSEGRIAPSTRIAFPIDLGGRPLRFNCRPAAQPVGYLSANPRAGSGEIDGSFSLEVAICINARSGKTASWPAFPMKVRGIFARLPGRR